MRNWLLVFHLFGIVFWVGALLVVTSVLATLPDEVGVARERFIFAARRLVRLGANLGAAVTIALGIALLAVEPATLRHGWMHSKLLLTLVLLGAHYWLVRRLRRLENDPAEATAAEFRAAHGIVSAVLLAILILAVLKPF
jgi:protoporphyrinogen IX oxidase